MTKIYFIVFVAIHSSFQKYSDISEETWLLAGEGEEAGKEDQPGADDGERDEGQDMELGSCSSDADCPPSDPVCSEFGFCQCEGYKPGDAECWQGSQIEGNSGTGTGGGNQEGGEGAGGGGG